MIGWKRGKGVRDGGWGGCYLEGREGCREIEREGAALTAPNATNDPLSRRCVSKLLTVT